MIALVDRTEYNVGGHARRFGDKYLLHEDLEITVISKIVNSISDRRARACQRRKDDLHLKEQIVCAKEGLNWRVCFGRSWGSGWQRVN
jgi:hypothetical protein